MPPPSPTYLQRSSSSATTSWWAPHPLVFSAPVSEKNEDDFGYVAAPAVNKPSSPRFFNAFQFMAKIEYAANDLSFKVGKVKDFKLRIQGPTEGRKGRLSVTAEVFEVAPEVAVVEFSKFAGDSLEYAKFCEEDVRPALKDTVWTWQGEGNKVDGED